MLLTPIFPSTCNISYCLHKGGRVGACYFWCKCSTSAEQQACSESSESCHRKQIARLQAAWPNRHRDGWRNGVWEQERARMHGGVWQKPQLIHTDCWAERMLNPGKAGTRGEGGVNRQDKGGTDCEEWMWRCSRGATQAQISGGQGPAFLGHPFMEGPIDLIALARKPLSKILNSYKTSDLDRLKTLDRNPKNAAFVVDKRSENGVKPFGRHVQNIWVNETMYLASYNGTEMDQVQRSTKLISSFSQVLMLRESWLKP